MYRIVMFSMEMGYDGMWGNLMLMLTASVLGSVANEYVVVARMREDADAYGCI